MQHVPYICAMMVCKVITPVVEQQPQLSCLYAIIAACAPLLARPDMNSTPR
jgi:hypothetical protein